MQLKQLRKNGFEVENTSNKEDIDTFVSICWETMKRVGVKIKYFFSYKYLYALLQNKGFKSRLLFAKKRRRNCCWRNFYDYNPYYAMPFGRYCANAYLNERPVKLTIDEADYWEMH